MDVQTPEESVAAFDPRLSGEDYLQKAASSVGGGESPGCLEDQRDDQEACSRMATEGCPNGIMEMTDFGPRASHDGEGGALALEGLHSD